MALKSLAEVQRAAEQAGVLLQEIHDYCAENSLNWNHSNEAKVRFPRGFIRKANTQRSRLAFVKNSTLKDNLAYTLILSDVILWLKIRTDLWGTPKDMLNKLYVFLVGSMCESITKEYLDGVCPKGYVGRTHYLVEQNIITKELRDELEWLWDMRNRMHLFLVDQPEYELPAYKDSCHPRCVAAFRGLLQALRAHSQAAAVEVV